VGIEHGGAMGALVFALAVRGNSQAPDVNWVGKWRNEQARWLTMMTETA